MYCVFDDDNKLIAFHDKRRAVEVYIDRVYQTSGVNLKLLKLRKGERHIIKGKDDLYLVRYADTFIQSGYIDYITYSSLQIMEDNILAADILYRLLETERLSKKENKTIRKAIEIMEEIIKEDREYTPSLSELKLMKMNYDPYIYNSGIEDF